MPYSGKNPKELKDWLDLKEALKSCPKNPVLVRTAMVYKTFIKIGADYQLLEPIDKLEGKATVSIELDPISIDTRNVVNVEEVFADHCVVKVQQGYILAKNLSW